MATRTYAYQENLAATSANTTATPADACTLTFTPGSSETWALFFSAEHCQTTDNFTQANARFLHSTAGTVLSIDSREPYTQTANVEWFPISGCIPVTFGASPPAQTFKLQYYNETGTASTQMRNAKIFALKLTSNDLAVVDLTTSSQTTNTGTKLTWTAPATASYDFIVSYVLQSSDLSTTENAWMVMPDGFTHRWETGTKQFAEDLDDRNNLSFVVPNVACTSGQTVTLQYTRGVGTGTISIMNAAIVGLRRSDFDNTYASTGDLSGRSTSSTSFVQRDSTSDLVFTPASAVDHLLLGSANLNRTSNTTRSAMQSEFPSGTVYGTTQFRGGPGGYHHRLDFRMYASMPATSATLTWKYESVEAGTTNSDYAAMAAYQLQVSGAGAAPATAPVIGNRRRVTIPRTRPSTELYLAPGWKPAIPVLFPPTGNRRRLPNPRPRASLDLVLAPGWQPAVPVAFAPIGNRRVLARPRPRPSLVDVLGPGLAPAGIPVPAPVIGNRRVSARPRPRSSLEVVLAPGWLPAIPVNFDPIRNRRRLPNPRARTSLDVVYAPLAPYTPLIGNRRRVPVGRPRPSGLETILVGAPTLLVPAWQPVIIGNHRILLRPRPRRMVVLVLGVGTPPAAIAYLTSWGRADVAGTLGAAELVATGGGAHEGGSLGRADELASAGVATNSATTGRAGE